MSDFRGKKLLILAGSVHEADLVRRAKELGIYTIVTDYYDLEKSPAKKIADEYWNISWSDIDLLEKKCKEVGIDGITAGYSEFTVECLIKLCNRLNLPCYCTEEQLEITRHKILFKEECRKNHVPVIKEYATPQDVNTFPVIIKPVDRGGSIGISVASNEQQLKEAYAYAMEMSVCKKVIIEDFISSGTKFDAYYTVCNGEITLVSTSDTINAESNGFDKVVQSGWVFPSIYHDSFVSSVDNNIKNMIKNMGITDGFLFFSGFADGKSFKFFETGFRLSGSHMYRYIASKGLSDIQDIFITYALTGKTQNVSFQNASKPTLKAVILNFYANSGTFMEYSGEEEISELRECKYALYMCVPNTVCEDDKAILTKLAMFHLYDIDETNLSKATEFVNSNFKALSAEGKDLTYDRIEPSIIKKWWN